ncbi:MAG: PorV/PorQ family protein [Bacteroidales bacterium]|nr:PorV/PorQ family protein [Bacteroidales bacterium]
MRKIVLCLAAVAGMIISWNASGQSFGALVYSGDARALAAGDAVFTTPDMALSKIRADISYGMWQPYALNNNILDFNGRMSLGKSFGLHIGYRLNNIAAYEVVDENGNEKGTFDPSEHYFTAGVALRLADKIYVDVDGRFMTGSLAEGVSTSAFATDITARYSTRSFTAGIRLANLGTTYTVSNVDYSLPLNVRAGGEYRLTFAGGDHCIALGADLAYFLPESYRSLMANASIQYNYNRMIFVRGGYRYSSAADKVPGFVSLGAGFRFKGVEFNAAYLLASTGTPVSGSMIFGLAFSM